MKKYLLSSIAIIMAVFAVAFTPVKEKKTAAQPETPYFWYHYDSDLDQLGTLINNPSNVKIVKSSVPTSCEDDAGQPDCVRGYSSQRTPGEENPPAGEDQIRMTDEE